MSNSNYKLKKKGIIINWGGKVIIRFAKPQDKEFVIEFTKHTWEDGDYIEYVWDSWINDTMGKLFVAEVDGKPVGIIHVAFLTPEYAWLEGARVHPDYRGKGIATELNKVSIAWAKKNGARVIGFLTADTNYAVHRIAEKMGMKKVAQWFFGKVDLEKFKLNTALNLEDVKIADVCDFRDIMNFLLNSDGYKLVKGYFSWFFEILPLDARFIMYEIRNSRIFITRDYKTKKITAIGIQEFYLDWESKALSMYLGYLDGKPEDVYKIINKVYAAFKHNNIKRYRLRMPATKIAEYIVKKVPMFGDLGYVRVYEKEL